MVQVIFYAKPGYRGNVRQLRVLEMSGHDVVVRDLLAEPWSAEELRSYFGDRPVADWFNCSAVRVKNGEIVPERQSDCEAMALLLADHGLIRRPLMQAAGERHVGWEPDFIARWIGLGTTMSPAKETCAQGTRKHETAEGSSCDLHHPAGLAAD